MGDRARGAAVLRCPHTHPAGRAAPRARRPRRRRRRPLRRADDAGRGPWCCGAAANVPARRRAAAGRSWYASARSSAAWYASARSSAAWYASPGHGDAARFSARFSAAAGRDDAAAWPTAGHAAYGRTTRLPAEARHAAASWDAPWLSASRPSARFPSAAAPAGAVNESSDSRSRAPHCLKKIGSLGARSAPRKTDDPSF